MGICKATFRQSNHRSHIGFQGRQEVSCHQPDACTHGTWLRNELLETQGTKPPFCGYPSGRGSLSLLLWPQTCATWSYPRIQVSLLGQQRGSRSVCSQESHTLPSPPLCLGNESSLGQHPALCQPHCHPAWRGGTHRDFPETYREIWQRNIKKFVIGLVVSYYCVFSYFLITTSW